MTARLLLGAALLAAAVPAHAEDWDFVLVNHTGKTIKLIEVSDSGKAAWAAEELDEGIVHDPVRAGVSHEAVNSGSSLSASSPKPNGECRSAVMPIGAISALTVILVRIAANTALNGNGGNVSKASQLVSTRRPMRSGCAACRRRDPPVPTVRHGR